MADSSDVTDWKLNRDHISVNMESFQFVWLDAHLTTSSSILNARRYRKLIIELNTAVRFFTSPLKCIDFMKTIKKEKIILVISGSLAEEVLADIHPYNQLSAVFIFCLHENHSTHLLTQYDKIIGIFVDRDVLLQSIKETIDKIEKQIFSIVIFDPISQKLTPNLSKAYVSFLWPQLFINVVRNLPIDENEKNQFSDKCEEYYRNNETEMENIKIFRAEYTSDKAIEWYTKNTFLYKVMNKALRCDNIELIYSFPFFINDLCYQLKLERENLIETEVLTLYRGMIIPKTQMKYYNDMEGKFILTKCFTSATRNRNIALNSAGQSLDTDLVLDREIGVLFEISVDPHERILFANINNGSEFGEEFLFGPNTTFHVNSVKFDQTIHCWIINMTARDVFDDFLHQYFRLEQEELRNYQPFAYLGRLLFDKLGKLQTAEKYFRMLLRKLPSNHDNIPTIYFQMGDLNLLRKNYNTAVMYYDKAMKYFKCHSTDNTNIIDCLLKIGNTHLSEGVPQKTLIFGKQAMEMLDKTSKGDLARRAKIHRMIGKACLLQGKTVRNRGKIYLAIMEINKVEKHLQTAYKIFNDIQPLENTHLVSILSDLGDFYETNGDSLMARKLLEEQLHMAEKYLPLNHPQQSEYLQSFIHLHELHGVENLAMKIAWKKLRNYQETFGKTHPIVAQTLMSMGYYDKVCRILFEIEPIDEYGITQCLNGLARRTHLSKRSIELFQKWLDYLKQNYPTTESRIADVYCQFANIYNDRGQFDQAFTYLHKSVRIYRHNQDHLKLRTVEDFMRHIEQGIGRLHIANIVCDDNWENGIIFHCKTIDT